MADTDQGWSTAGRERSTRALRRRRTTRSGLAAFGAFVTGLALAAGLASAAQTTIGFDDLTDGTVVGDQYADRAVVFGTAGQRNSLEVRQDDEAVRSAPNAASFSNCASDETVPRCTNRATGHLSAPVTALTVYAGSTDPEEGSADVVVLEGFDAGGRSLDIDRVSVEGGAPFDRELTINAPEGATIARFEIRLASPVAFDARLAIDDLTITTADATTPTTTTQPPTATTTTTPPPTTTTTEPPTTTTQPPPASNEEEPAKGAVFGPPLVRFGEPTVYTVSFPGRVSSYRWDIDGSGNFAIDTGSSPRLEARPHRLGPAMIRVRAIGAAGTAEAAKAIQVTRPALTQLTYTPARPRPGQKVSFRLEHRAEAQFAPAYYAWKLEGVRPRTRTVVVDRSRSRGDARAAAAGRGGPATVRLSNAQPTKVPKLTAIFKRTGVHRAEVAIVGADGSERVVHADVVVTGSSRDAVVFGSKPARSRTEPLDCDPSNKFVECGSITAPRAAIVRTPVTLQNSTPSSRYCWDVNRVGAGPGATTKLAVSRLQQKRDLVYPPSNEFYTQGVYPGGKSTNVVGKPTITTMNAAASKPASVLPGAPSARGAQATQNRRKQVCVTFRTQTVSWDLGDGTRVPSAGQGKPASPPSPTAPTPLPLASPVISHPYESAGAYRVTVVSRRFSINKSKLPPAGDPDYAEKTRKLFGGGLGDTEGDVDALVAKGLLTPYLVKTTIRLEVQDAVCGQPIMVKGIAVRSFVPAGANAVNPFSGALDGCLLLDTSTGAGHPVYEPFPGEYLSLNGVVVRRVEALAKDAQSSSGDRLASSDVLVDPTKGTLTARDFSELDLELFDPARVGSSLRSIAAGRTDQIQVPVPSTQGSLVPKRATAALPDYGGGKDLKLPGGFQGTGGRVLLSPDSSAFFRATVAEVTPINGGTPPVLLGGSTATARAAAAGANEFKPGFEPDFSLDLSGLRLGAFAVRNFRLDHFPGDGWYGAGAFDLPLGGTTYKLDAPYKPPGGTTTKCADVGKEVGPSGLRISDTGFDFAGGRVTGFSIPIGPIEVNCFAASFSASPFTLLGYASGRFPPSTGGKQEIAHVDACVLVAILEPGEKTRGCDIKANEFGVDIEGVGQPASQKQFWLAVRGDIDLLKQFKVNGGLDLRAGAGLVKIGAQVGITPRWYGPFRIGGSVFGSFRLDPVGFEIGGEVELAFLGCPACVDVRALVSSKGIGACADTFLVSGGFVYPWGGSLSLYGGCGWEQFAPIRLASTAGSSTRLGVGGPPRARAAQGADTGTRVQVSAREAQAPALAFELEGAEGSRAPRATLVGPSGKRIVVPDKAGHTVLRADGTTVTSAREFDPATQIRVLTADALPRDALAPQRVPFDAVGPGPHPGRVTPTVEVPFTPTTIVSIPHASAGTWRIESHPGSPRIARVRIREKLPTRQVRAEVVTRREGRRLRYHVRPIAGQTVRFVEEGPGVARQIGRVRGGSGELRFPSGYGLAGRRTIRAIIEQSGIAVERRLLDSYVAPGPPVVPAPKNLNIMRGNHGVLRACWDKVPRATSYRLRIKGTDGSVKPLTTTSTCVALPGFDRSVGAGVDVEAVTSYGSSPKPAREALKRRPRRPVLGL